MDRANLETALAEGRSVRQASHTLRQRFREVAPDLAAPAPEVLIAIWLEPHLNGAELAAVVGIDPSSLTHASARLASAGYITEHRSAGGRVHQREVTARGRKLLAGVSDRWERPAFAFTDPASTPETSQAVRN